MTEMQQHNLLESDDSPACLKVLITADLHYGISDWVDQGVRAFIASMANSAPFDAVLVAGDVAESVTYTEKNLGAVHREILTRLHELSDTVAFCSGNHDLWSRNRALESWEYLDQMLPEAAHATGSVYLEQHSIWLRNDCVVVGSYGHYDFTLVEPGLEFSGSPVKEFHYQAKTPPGYSRPLWNDAWYLRWGMSDPEVCALLCKRFAARLDLLPNHHQTMLAITHGIPISEMNGHAGNPNPTSRFLAAYGGSNKLGQLLTATAAKGISVRAFSGHTHKACAPLERQGVIYSNIGGDYGAPRATLVVI